MLKLSLELEVISPLFMGGATQKAEVRPASFKGALRHWYRAVEPDFPLREPILFGGVGQGSGQSPILLRVMAPTTWAAMPWLDRDQLSHFKVGHGVTQKNGVNYLGFPFSMPGNDERTAIPPGTRLQAECIVPALNRLVAPTPREPQAAVLSQETLPSNAQRQETHAREGQTSTEQGQEDQHRAAQRQAEQRRHLRGLLSAWWLLTHVGGLGMRARRGFGSVGLVDWTLTGASQALEEDLRALPILMNTTQPSQFAKGLEEGLEAIRGFFPQSTPDGLRPDWLGPRTRGVLLTKGQACARPLSWAWALQDVGLPMQRFRASRDPDRTRANAHLLFLNRIPDLAGLKGAPLLGEAPERTAFGLPLTFRARKLKGRFLQPNNFELTPAGSDVRGRSKQRHPAPFWIRLVRIGDRLHPLVTLLDGALPGAKDGVAVGQGGGRDPLIPADVHLLETFLDTLAQGGAGGITIRPGDST